MSTDYLLCKTDERLPLNSLAAHEVRLDNKIILIDAKTDKEQKILQELEDLDDNNLNMIRAMITAYKAQKKQE